MPLPPPKMKFVLVIMRRTEPVAASDGVDRQADSADAARMVEQNFMTRNQPNIVFLIRHLVVT
ncbi:MAG TPA: hypothetical protein VEJ43_06265 [Pseudolabrys sp.]|nr:hypothetical protein [Pseudolabrys sp.]